MTTNLPVASAIEAALIRGDLSQLTPEQRVAYYNRVCESVGLNPLTQPFSYLKLNGKEVLYARKDATDQLRKIHGVSIYKLETQVVDNICIVTASARDKDGKEDSEIGAVDIKGKVGENLANAMMKASTKAKRRVTLSICGMGMLDESEADSIPDARPIPAQGEVVPPPAIEEQKNVSSPLISEPQCKRMHAIANKSGIPIIEVRALLDEYGFDRSTDVTRDVYEEICERIEAWKMPEGV